MIFSEQTSRLTNPYRVKDASVAVYATRDDTLGPITRLSYGDLISVDVLSAEPAEYVGIRLPDGTEGFISGETRLFALEGVRTLDGKLVMHVTPEVTAPVVANLPAGQVVAVLDEFRSENQHWLQVRDSRGREGFVPGGTLFAEFDSKERANNDMLYGGLWFVGGLVATAVSYGIVAEDGGTYMIFWGAVIFGGAQMVRGIFRSVAAARQMSPEEWLNHCLHKELEIRGTLRRKLTAEAG